MHERRFSRRTCLALAPAMLFGLPLTLAGCGGSESSGSQTSTADFKETHKDSMNEYLKTKHQTQNVGGRGGRGYRR